MGPIAIYKRDFLERAHPTRMATEPRAMPRARTADGDAEIWPTATKEDIARGYKIAPDFLFATGAPRRCGLRRLDVKNYSWVQHHLSRKKSGNNKAMWIFTTYDDETAVNWMQLDLDRHYAPGMTADEKAEIDFYFHQQVRNLQDVADEQGFDIVWTTSPGDLDPFDGRHIQGLYAWIRLDRDIRVVDLRRFIAAFMEMNLLDIECCWSTKHRNVRLGGQEFVEVADPETISIIHPVKKRQREALGHFAVAWQAARPANAARLFKDALAWYRAQQQKASTAPSSASASEHQAEPTTGGNPGLSGRASSPHTRQTRRHAPASLPATAALINEPNTFKSATDALICSLITRKYRGDKSQFETAVQEGMAQLQAIRPATSKTCGDPHRLRSTVTRWMDWYFKGFRPDRCSSGARLTGRDAEDRKRVEYCLGLDRARILRHMNNLTYDEKTIASRFLDLAEKWNYRVAVKAIYDGPNALCSKPEWFNLLSKIKGILIVVDQKQIEDRKCRQWALASWFVQDIKQAEILVASVLQEEGEEKKKKEVYGWHQLSAAQFDLALAACGSNDPSEASWTTITSGLHDRSSNP
jgi:hypothetical protein